MTLKRKIFRTIVRLLEWMTLLQRPHKLINMSLEPIQEKNHVDIVVVAFNNADIIRYQYELIRKNIQDNYSYIVADNSTEPSVRAAIEQFCRGHEISYISMPKDYLNYIGTSYSHAAVLNYLCRRVLSKRQPAITAFIDHDLFPIAQYSIAHHLVTQNVYGVLRERGAAWYIWPGMAFFRTESISPASLDFMPTQSDDAIYMDTGGSIWHNYYRTLERNELLFPIVEQVAIREGDDYHGDMVQYIDHHAWLHTINGSCWKRVADGKDHIVKQLLDKYLTKC